jgi:hypothetical protein
MEEATIMFNPRMNTLITMIVAAAATRLIPHPPNMTSVTALALFGGAYFADRRLAFIVPLIALLASDFLLGFYQHMEVPYLSADCLHRLSPATAPYGTTYCRRGSD